MYRMAHVSGLTGVFMLLIAAGALAQEPGPPEDAEIVFINSQTLLQQAPGASQAQQTFNEELSQYRTEVQGLESELDSLRTAYEQQEAMLSEEAREERQREIAEKQQEYQQRVGELEQQAAQRQQELLEPILSEVGDVVETLRQERGYSMVFDLSAGGVLSADPQLDITELVVQRLEADGENGDEPGGEPEGG